MPETPMTRAQKTFLRHLAAAGGTLPPGRWPSALIFRRWLHNPTFHATFLQFRDAAPLLTGAAGTQSSSHLARKLDRLFPPPQPLQRV